MVSWTHPEKAVSRLNSDALVTQLPSSSRVVNFACIVVNIINQKWDILVINIIACVLVLDNFIND